ncbi:sporulation inhibitor of replication protein SirA [Alkalibacillus haloalkaliphilus]|uniref:Sporulation inhibitor of replication protein SirA n=1 Tax=Alkalibacillus haloalkaliphilus TaxID=94136 RepID=A0A511W1P5_9BACI|nr:sporulation inhibitor of replication protein SirA [Alkalibacillus haloalkaliphilus]GEN45010.1 hypothetical protein AHA02nite_07860 [Alkalibacillus haloalkaliphilus]
MYQYSLYFFKPTYAIHFYYKVDVLYRFLDQYRKGKYTDDTTQRQVSFVLEYVILNDVYEHLTSQKFSHKLDVKAENNELIIKSDSLDMKAVRNGYAIDVYANSLIDADQLFFQYIKEFHPYVFVVNFDSRECGWILPLAKKANYHI